MGANKVRRTDMDGASIESLPNDKPVVYKLFDAQGKNVYTGVAGRGNVRERLKDHLPGGPDPIPGATRIEIQQKNSIDEAREAEGRIIARSKPKYNKRGK